MLSAPNTYRSMFRKPDGSYDWQAELNYGWSLIDQASCGSLAVCIVECIQSSAGIHVLPPDYLKALKRHCKERGMLLIVDEAQTGTLGNGLPLRAVVASAEIDRVCTERGYCFYTTHTNDTLPAAVGDKVLEVVIRDNLVQNSKELGVVLQEGLRRLQSRYSCIGDVRGRGLMAGVETMADNDKRPPLTSRDALLAARTSSASSGMFRIVPPITITREQINHGLEVLEETFASTPGNMPLY
ncbi:hypothetical protein DL766_002406 [Monosporascus sp. MC13-8B]|uniref:Ornithine aminotransferase n=1 Tax=Monosporascus cannonballus TaxID=155416 RepID=A0ABY0HG01_9PEZI|nr:hypothetical protein DL762_001987 [Monosporascus cannonballus]RYO97111.1 hypothetical protein DL763_002901 [Monosporascus cannonballus]RYP35673.1 hypothetical protein DL766_002406 [Monosporascus sp. MC13-8B]